MRFVQLDKLENYLFSKGFHKTNKTFDHPSSVWQQTLFYKNNNNREVRVTVLREPDVIPLKRTNNVVSITNDGSLVTIDFRMKFWKELSIDTKTGK